MAEAIGGQAPSRRPKMRRSAGTLPPYPGPLPRLRPPQKGLRL